MRMGVASPDVTDPRRAELAARIGTANAEVRDLYGLWFFHMLMDKLFAYHMDVQMSGGFIISQANMQRC